MEREGGEGIDGMEREEGKGREERGEGDELLSPFSNS